MNIFIGEVKNGTFFCCRFRNISSSSSNWLPLWNLKKVASFWNMVQSPLFFKISSSDVTVSFLAWLATVLVSVCIDSPSLWPSLWAAGFCLVSAFRSLFRLTYADFYRGVLVLPVWTVASDVLQKLPWELPDSMSGSSTVSSNKLIFCMVRIKSGCCVCKKLPTFLKTVVNLLISPYSSCSIAVLRYSSALAGVSRGMIHFVIISRNVWVGIHRCCHKGIMVLIIPGPSIITSDDNHSVTVNVWQKYSVYR